MDELVEAALAIDRVSDDYLVKMTPAQAGEFLSRADAYNIFTSEDLVELLEAVDGEIPPMRFGPDNPNTGKPHHTYMVGNEGSRVVYLAVNKFYLEERFQGKPFEYPHLGTELELLGLRAHANEAWVDQDDDKTFKFRFWWD